MQIEIEVELKVNENLKKNIWSGYNHQNIIIIDGIYIDVLFHNSDFVNKTVD